MAERAGTRVAVGAGKETDMKTPVLLAAAFATLAAPPAIRRAATTP
jgi:hypothetical protein